MRLSALCAALCAAMSLAASDSQTDFTAKTTISIQPAGAPPSAMHTLAQIHYNPTTLEASISSYESPFFEHEPDLLKFGVYNSKSSTWERATATSAHNFGKGYSPLITLTLDSNGEIAGVSCRSERIDAGHTRDFGPKVVVARMMNGKAPELNKPIALSKEGKVEVEVTEKTMLQK